MHVCASRMGQHAAASVEQVHSRQFTPASQQLPFLCALHIKCPGITACCFQWAWTAALRMPSLQASQPENCK